MTPLCSSLQARPAAHRLARRGWVCTLCLAAVLSVPARAATYYVDAGAANDLGDGSLLQPKRYLHSAMQLLSAQGGDTLIVAPGSYAGPENRIDGVGAGSAAGWNTVRAASPGSVTVGASLALPLANHYLAFEDLRFDSAETKSVTGRYVKFRRCSFRGGPATGNTVNLAIGTNDATPGAQYILVEDAYSYGPGGRYNILVYNADRIVLRRVVARHEDGWSDTQGNPQANVSLYNSSNVLTQNLLLLDSRPGGYFEAALYHPSNGVAPSSNIRNQGAIIVNIGSNGVGWDGPTAAVGGLLENSVIWNTDYLASSNGSAHAGIIRNVTAGKAAQAGINDWRGGGNYSVRQSLLWQVNGSNLSAMQSQDLDCYAPACGGALNLNPATAGLRYLPRLEAGSMLASAGSGGVPIGATVLQRLGAPGTLYGDPGYDQPTAEPLWPWPNEAAIQSALCGQSGITSGFCASSSLTTYIWEMLGNPIPPEIYGAVPLFANGFE